jgi:uncharacterized membrane protein
MGSVKESVQIEAPAERVWAVVSEDFKNATKWTSGLDKAELLTDGPTGRGTRLRYTIRTPAGANAMEVEHDVYDKPKVTSGRIIKGPVKGTWKYAYSEKGGVTTVTYSMDYEAASFLMKPFMGVIERQLPADVRKTLLALKKYVESGKGPQIPAARPAARARPAAKPAARAATPKAKK